MVEVFGNLINEPAGEQFVNQCTADAAGLLQCQDATFANWPYLAITVTDVEVGTTSGFYLVETEGSNEEITHYLYLPLIIK